MTNQNSRFRAKSHVSNSFLSFFLHRFTEADFDVIGKCVRQAYRPVNNPYRVGVQTLDPL